MAIEEINEDELVNIIEKRTALSRSVDDIISREREDSLDFYNQEPYGTEQEGRSKFVTSEVRDTIEWILPQLMDMFLGGENPVSFRPQNADDIEGAEQEASYVRYAVDQQNNGFLNLYEWFKDALLSKNGTMKTYWDENELETDEEYENQSLAELIELNKDEGLEIKKITSFIKDLKAEDNKKQIKEYKTVEALSKDIANKKIPIDDPNFTFDIEARREEDLSRVDEYVVPPENLLVDANQTTLDLNDTEFVREDFFLTESDLRKMDIDEEIIENLPSEGDLDVENTETQNRFKKEGGIFNLNTTDRSTRRIKVSDVYIKVDFNGDGIAERRFVKLGADNVVLENKEVDTQPYTTITPNIMAHKFYGMSIADMVADIQELSSTLWRQTLDSLYLANNPRHAVLSGQVELDDLLTSRPGGIVREDVSGAVRPLNTEFVGANSLPIMNRIELMREQRTGVSQASQGLNPDALADATNMVGTMLMNAAQLRIKMIARIFAEVGMKQRMLKVHELVLKHEKNEKIFELNGEFVTVKPSGWKTRRDMKVNVGIGFAEKKEKIIATERILNIQQQIFQAQGGEGALLNATNIYNALQDLQNLTGLDSRDRYFSNPANFKPPPQPEDPTSEALDIAEAEITLRAASESAKHSLEVKKHFDNVAFKERELASKQATQILNAENTADKTAIDTLFKTAEIRQKEVDQEEQAFIAQQRGAQNV